MKFKTAPSDYAEVARSQKAWAREIAGKLERGELVDDFDGAFAGAILRLWADSLPTLEPGDGRSRRWKVCYASVAMEYEALRRKGVSDFAAKDKLAGLHDVSVETIRAAIVEQGPAAKSWFDSWNQAVTSAKLSRK